MLFMIIIIIIVEPCVRNVNKLSFWKAEIEIFPINRNKTERNNESASLVLTKKHFRKPLYNCNACF